MADLRVIFDPWISTVEEAVAAQALEQHRPTYAQPIFQWEAAQTIAKLRANCEKGDGYDVLRCIHLCALHELVMPTWLAKDYIRRYRLINHAELGSWDEAFGRPFRKGSQLARIRFRRKNRTAIYLAVIAAVEADPARAIDESMFEEVGKKFGAGDTLAEEMYREALKLGLPDAKDVKRRLSASTRRPARSAKLTGTKRRS